MLKDWGQLGVEAEKAGQKKPPKYLAVHEYTELPTKDSKEHHAAMNTPWRDEIVKTWVSYERRMFKHHKNWQRNAQ